MKVFAFVMSFVLLALTCLPCADRQFAGKADMEKTGFVKSPSQHSDQDHNDDCSPFCNCSCCASSTVNHVFTTISDPFINGNRFIISYLPHDVIEVSLPIWQPPQLS